MVYCPFCSFRRNVADKHCSDSSIYDQFMELRGCPRQDIADACAILNKYRPQVFETILGTMRVREIPELVTAMQMPHYAAEALERGRKPDDAGGRGSDGT